MSPNLTKKDFIYATVIGVSFALFSLPILKNLNFSFIQLNLKFIILVLIFFTLLANVSIWIAGLIGQKIPLIFQIAKFSAVGAFNTFLDWGILNFLIYLTNITNGIGYASFKGFSFFTAVMASYFWNKYWTFESKSKVSTEEAGKFIGVSVIGALINILTAVAVVHYLTPLDIMTPKRLANLGAAIATFVALFWNFVGYKVWVFKK